MMANPPVLAPMGRILVGDVRGTTTGRLFVEALFPIVVIPARTELGEIIVAELVSMTSVEPTNVMS